MTPAEAPVAACSSSLAVVVVGTGGEASVPPARREQDAHEPGAQASECAGGVS